MSDSVSPPPLSYSDTSPVRIFIVDDHLVVRQGLRHFVERSDTLSVIGEAADTEGAFARILELSPDLAFIDVMVGGWEGMGGIDLTRRLQVHDPSIRVLMTSMHDDVYYIRKAFEAGAAGFIQKDDMGELMTEAVETILSGRRYLNEEVSGAVNLKRT